MKNINNNAKRFLFNKNNLSLFSKTRKTFDAFLAFQSTILQDQNPIMYILFHSVLSSLERLV